jgi:hypothetical protein
MSYGTVITQGNFVATGNPVTLNIRSDFDWIRVLNETQFVATPAGGQANGVDFFFRKGMPMGQGLMWSKVGAVDVLSGVAIAAGNGFFAIDTSNIPAGPAVAVTAGTNAAQPVYNTGNTGLLRAGAIVRVVNSAHTNLNGQDFTVDTVVAATSFRLANALQQAPGAIAGAAGFWRYISPDLATYKLFAPSKRTIANITQAAQAAVTTLVDHGLVVGQQVRLMVPPECGMVEANGQLVTVTALTNAGTFVCDLNTVAFTPFVYPLIAAVPCNFAEMLPVGGGVAGDETRNQGYVGVILGGGLAAIGAVANGPAGINLDVCSWYAGKSVNL